MLLCATGSFKESGNHAFDTDASLTHICITHICCFDGIMVFAIRYRHEARNTARQMNINIFFFVGAVIAVAGEIRLKVICAITPGINKVGKQKKGKRKKKKFKINALVQPINRRESAWYQDIKKNALMIQIMIWLRDVLDNEQAAQNGTALQNERQTQHVSIVIGWMERSTSLYSRSVWTRDCSLCVEQTRCRTSELVFR